MVKKKYEISKEAYSCAARVLIKLKLKKNGGKDRNLDKEN